MSTKFKQLSLLTLGVFLLMSTSVFAAKNECYSDAELKDFKTLYIKLQNQLNYEAKDAYLDKNMQVQLKPHAKNTPYPGKEFEAALFGEYQNSLRKVGKLYQDAKFEGNDDFKSNTVLVNFMKAIDDKSSESQDFISKTKIKDVIDALEEASKKKYAKNADKKFVITSGDKYLLEKLLTHAQDRICSVNKFEKTNKDTALFKADYLQNVKNAPLNALINTIKHAPIEKDSKIDLKPASSLTADLVDTDIAVKSAITDNVNQLSAWVKKVKSKGAACLAAIKTKSFANKIQGQVQGCNFGRFMDTLGQGNVDNLESVLHFINANERLLNRAVAKAETNLDELKLEGFIGNTFQSLGTEIKCTMIDSANSEDKKVFIRNLPYDEKLNKFDMSGISCKTSSKLLTPDTCKKQFDLVSDNLGRGIELKPKKNVDQSLVFSINEAKSCSNIAVKDLKSSSDSSNSQDAITSEEMCIAQSKDGMAYTWNPKSNKCSEIDISSVNSIEQCMALRKQGKVFNWDVEKKSCNEFSALILDAAQKQSEQMCEVKKKEGFSFKWNSANKSCDQSTTLSASEQKSLEACEARSQDGFKWNMSTKACDGFTNLSASEQKSALACEAKSNDRSSFKWNIPKKVCDESSLLSASEQKSALACEAKSNSNSSFKWNTAKKACDEAPILSESEQKSALACEAKSNANSSFKWNHTKKACDESPILSESEQKSALACEAKSNANSSFKWNHTKKSCDESPILSESEQKSALACEAKTNSNSSFKWNNAKKSCDESPILSASEQKLAQACEAKSNGNSSFKWNTAKKSCDESPILSASEQKSKDLCEAQSKDGVFSKWDIPSKKCLDGTSGSGGSNANGGSSGTLSSSEQQSKLACEAKALKWDTQKKMCSNLPLDGDSSVSLKQLKLACETKSSPGITYKWNPADQSCSRSPSSSSGNGSEGSGGNKSGSDKIILSSGGGSSSNSGNGSPNSKDDSKAPDTSEELKNGSSGSGSKSQLKTDQNSGNKSGSNSSNLSQLPNGGGSGNNSNSGSKSDQSSNGSGKNSDNKIPTLNENKTPSAEQIKCEAKKKDSMAYVWMFEEKECVELPIGDAKAKCEGQKKTGYSYKWSDKDLKCEEKAVDQTQNNGTKESCEAQKKDGVVFKWDDGTNSCNETVSSTDDKKDDKKKSDEDSEETGRLACEEKNAKWVEEVNNGTPSQKYKWDGKTCKDMKPAKEDKKEKIEEVAEQEEAPSAPKRAPARFVPINIPSRQIYLMPGMP